jgi:hypothetical protein
MSSSTSNKGRAKAAPIVYKTDNSLGLIKVDQEPSAIRVMMGHYKNEWSKLVENEKALIKKKNGLDPEKNKAEREKVKTEITNVQGKIKAVNEKAENLKNTHNTQEANRDAEKRARRK